MGLIGLVYVYGLLFLALLLLPSEAITVSPALCPTNKIAPYKRHAGYYGTARTFGAFYDLLVPGGSNGNLPLGPQFEDDQLQEEPQEDDPNDCGEIEDYDENDLSSVTPQKNRRQDYANRFFGHSQNHRPPSNYPQRPPQYPQRPPPKPQRPPPNPQRPPNFPQGPSNFPQRPPNYPQRPPNNPQRPTTVRPSHPTRPPYWSGGFFGTNDYRPPLQQYPSANIKPIHEYSDNNEVPYRPTLVGGTLNQVIGVSPIVPSTEAPTPFPEFNNPPRTTHDSSVHPTAPRRPRLRNGSNTVLGSFADLFFK